MVTKLRTNSGKRFTAKSDDTGNRPTVFTQLSNLERARTATLAPTGNKGDANGTDSKFDTMINKFKEFKKAPATAPVVTALDESEEEGWTIVIHNPKKVKKPKQDATIVPEILYAEPEGDSLVPDLEKSYYWPTDIKIRLKEHEAVNVQMLLSSILNTFQENDINTVIAPKDYESQYDIEHYITKSTLIPAGENDLKRYIIHAHTYKESIIIRVFFVSRSLFYQLIKDHGPYYAEINTEVRLNTLQVEKSVVAGFFVCLHAKLETAYDFQVRISNELLGGNIDLIQITVFDLNFNRKGSNPREFKTRVFSVRTKEDDEHEVVYYLKTACKTSTVYNFFPWDEYTCLPDDDKVTIIEGQNKYLKEYVSIVIDEFHQEPANMTLWRLPSESTHKIPITVETVHTPGHSPERQPSVPVTSTAPNEPLAASIQGLTDGWDEDDLNTSDILPADAPTVVRVANIDNDQITGDTQDVTMRDATSLHHTPPKQQRTDKDDKRRCLESSASTTAVSVAETLSNLKQMDDPRYFVTVTDYLRSVPSGDGELLFDVVFELTNGRREFIGITRKQKEMKAYLKIVHQELARAMNDEARTLVYPDQNISNKNSFHYTLPWNGFTLLAGADAYTKGMAITKTLPPSMKTNYEYRTDGRKYYTGAKSSDQVTSTSATSSGAYSAAITTYKSAKLTAMQSTQPYNDNRSTMSYQTRTPSLDTTVSSSTLTTSTNNEELITVLRQDLATMQSQQQMYQSAMNQFKQHLLDQAEQSIQRHTHDLTQAFEHKLELRAQQSEANYQQALSNATTSLKQDIATSTNSFSDTLSAIREMMMTQQQQMQDHQRQMQEQQAMNRDFHQSMMDRLINTDNTLQLLQQSPSLTTIQTSLLTQQANQTNPNVNSVMSSQTVTIPPLSDDLHQTQSNKTLPTPPAPTGRHTTQTLLTTSTKGTMMLSSGNKNIGQSSRPSGGSTKNL